MDEVDSWLDSLEAILSGFDGYNEDPGFFHGSITWSQTFFQDGRLTKEEVNEKLKDDKRVTRWSVIDGEKATMIISATMNAKKCS